MVFIFYCLFFELEVCMIVWEFMEMIYLCFYIYIIKNVYLNFSDVFDIILEDERVLECVFFVIELYDDFI